MAKTKKEMAVHAEKMQTRVEELFRELMPDVTLVRVVAEPDRDWDGSDILDVTVVFDGVELLEGKKMNELSARAWLHPDSDEDEPHPMFGFINVPDAKETGIVS